MHTSSSPVLREASCSCGQLQARVVGEPLRISVCHCLACQRRSGGVFATQARFPRDAVTVAGSSTQFALTGDEGTTCIFHFCPRCGATVYYLPQAMPDLVIVPVGVFADPSFPPPGVSVYEHRMHGWVSMPEDMEHYA